MKVISRLALMILVVMATLAIGCAQSNPVSTGFVGTGGYAINLSASAKSVPFGGSVVFNAVVQDADGNMVMTSPHSVTFTTTHGGQVTPIQAPLANGIAQVVYVAPQYVAPASLRAQAAADVEIPEIKELPTPTGVPSEFPRTDMVTASFQGAIAKISINVYKP
ncbi:MAG: hypothetical protein GX569_00495 [Candidatus Riflebacteria bacterium]|nr:hypothetical protein [Candidatus Riflebacteria bacterium]